MPPLPARLALFHRTIVRDVLEAPVRALLTLGGVALGIAVVVAVQVSNERAIGSFGESLDLLSGGADLTITANGLPIAEELIGDLSWVWDIGALTALVESSAALEVRPEAEPLRVFGVDLLSEAFFPTYRTTDGNAGDLGRDEFLDLLVDPAAIALPRSLAREFGVGVGDGVELALAGRVRTFRVASLLSDEGISRAFGGRIVVMDIAAAQWALGRLGEVDRIEIALDPEVDDEAVARRLRVQLPEPLLVTRPSDRIDDTRRITRAFRYNLNALSYIALAVGMILIYNALDMAVTRRRGEIGTLRTLGAGRRMIRNMLLIEAGLFGALGALIGVRAGLLLADAAGELVSRTVSTLYTGMPGATSRAGADWTLYLGMSLLGTALAMLSGAGPALRAMRFSPVESLKVAGGGAPEPGSAREGSRAGILALGVGAILAMAPPVAGFPFPGYVSGIMFIAGFGFLIPGLARRLARSAHQKAAGRLPAEACLALQTIEGRLPRLSVAVMSLTITVAMLVSVAIMVSSFRDTLVVWVDGTLGGDLYIRPAPPGATNPGNVLDPDLPRLVADIPGVAAIERFRSVRIQFRGFPALIAGTDFETLAARSGLLFVNGEVTADVATRLRGEDRVVVSEPLAVRHGLETGDTILLPTPSGVAPFRIEAVFYDYSSEGGLIVMDRGTWIRHRDDEAVSTLAVYLDTNADTLSVQGAIAEAAGPRIRISANASIRDQILRVFDQTFEVTYALEVIALAVAMLGIANTLAALVLERRPELAMLRFVGAARGQIRRMVVLEAGFIGLLGAAFGLLLGLLLSLLLVYVINFQSFGWTIQLSIPAGFLAQAILAVLVATLAAGLYPSRLALRVDPLRGIRAE